MAMVGGGLFSPILDICPSYGETNKTCATRDLPPNIWCGHQKGEGSTQLGKLIMVTIGYWLLCSCFCFSKKQFSTGTTLVRNLDKGLCTGVFPLTVARLMKEFFVKYKLD